MASVPTAAQIRMMNYGMCRGNRDVLIGDRLQYMDSDGVYVGPGEDSITVVGGVGDIAANDLVYVSAYDAGEGYVVVLPADADAIATMRNLYYCPAAITAGEVGYAFKRGLMTAENTDSGNVGDPVYADTTTPGGWNLSSPEGADDVLSRIGVIVVKSAGAGIISVDIGGGTEQFDIHNLSAIATTIPDIADVFAISDESVSGDPMGKATLQSLFDGIVGCTAFTAATVKDTDQLFYDDAGTVKKATFQVLMNGVDDLGAGAIGTGDKLLMIDADDGVAKAETIDDIATMLAGTVTATGLTATTGVLAIDAGSLTALGAAIVPGTDKVLIVDAGTDLSCTYQVFFNNISELAATGAAPALADNLLLDNSGVAENVTVQFLFNAMASLAADDTPVGGDSFMYEVAGVAKQCTISGLATLMAGVGLAADTGVLSVSPTESAAGDVVPTTDSMLFLDADDSNIQKKESVQHFLDSVDDLVAAAGAIDPAADKVLLLDAGVAEVATYQLFMDGLQDLTGITPPFVPGTDGVVVLDDGVAMSATLQVLFDGLQDLTGITPPFVPGTDGVVVLDDGVAMSATCQVFFDGIDDLAALAEAPALADSVLLDDNGTAKKNTVQFLLDAVHRLGAGAVATTDTFLMIDADDSAAKKETVDDLATLFAGTGLTATNAVIAVDTSQALESISGTTLVINSTNPMTFQIGAADTLLIDGAAIVSAAADDTAAEPAYIGTEAGGAATTGTTGDVGGALSVRAGDGSAGATTEDFDGAAGGALTLESGDGGDAGIVGGAGTADGKAGGAIYIAAGDGGDGGGAGAGTAGDGGAVSIDAGAVGAGLAAGVNGAIGIGDTYAESVSIGRATKTVDFPGGVVDLSACADTLLASGDSLLFNDVTDGKVKSEAMDDVATLLAGAGIDAASSVLSVNINGMTAAVVDVAADSIAILDATDSLTKLEAIADLVSGMTGAGLDATAGVLSMNILGMTAAVVDPTADSIAILDATDSLTKLESVDDLVTATAGAGIANVASQYAISADAITDAMINSEIVKGVAVKAWGALYMTGVPVDQELFTVAARIYEIDQNDSGGLEGGGNVNVPMATVMTADAAVTNIAAAINGDASATFSAVADTTNDIVFIYADTAGAAGNAIGLVEAFTNGDVSAATLVDGADDVVHIFIHYRHTITTTEAAGGASSAIRLDTGLSAIHSVQVTYEDAGVNAASDVVITVAGGIITLVEGAAPAWANGDIINVCVVGVA